MKALLALLLCAAYLSATAQTADAIYRQACGPRGEQFMVEQVKGQPPTASEPGKALVYFIQLEDSPIFTTRIGLDGDWVGVIQHDSYIFASVTPGEHHACAASQDRKHPGAEFAHFTAEAGKNYYYLVRGITGGVTYTLLFGAADRDEALYLIAADPQSVAHPKQ
jgi:hypothetical protein